MHKLGNVSKRQFGSRDSTLKELQSLRILTQSIYCQLAFVHGTSTFNSLPQTQPASTELCRELGASSPPRSCLLVASGLLWFLEKVISHILPLCEAVPSDGSC